MTARQGLSTRRLPPVVLCQLLTALILLSCPLDVSASRLRSILSTTTSKKSREDGFEGAPVVDPTSTSIVVVDVDVEDKGGNPVEDVDVQLEDIGGAYPALRSGKTGHYGKLRFLEDVGPPPCNLLRLKLPAYRMLKDLGCHFGFEKLRHTFTLDSPSALPVYPGAPVYNPGPLPGEHQNFEGPLPGPKFPRPPSDPILPLPRPSSLPPPGCNVVPEGSTSGRLNVTVRVKDTRGNPVANERVRLEGPGDTDQLGKTSALGCLFFYVNTTSGLLTVCNRHKLSLPDRPDVRAVDLGCNVDKSEHTFTVGVSLVSPEPSPTPPEQEPVPPSGACVCPQAIGIPCNCPGAKPRLGLVPATSPPPPAASGVSISAGIPPIVDPSDLEGDPPSSSPGGSGDPPPRAGSRLSIPGLPKPIVDPSDKEDSDPPSSSPGEGDDPPSNGGRRPPGKPYMELT